MQKTKQNRADYIRSLIYRIGRNVREAAEVIPAHERSVRRWISAHEDHWPRPDTLARLKDLAKAADEVDP